MPVLKGFKDGKAIIYFPDAKKYLPVLKGAAAKSSEKKEDVEQGDR